MIQVESKGIHHENIKPVSLIGVGPGNVELLTLRAIHIIQEADILLHDKLINPQILEFAATHVEMFDVGKRYHDNQNQKERQERINDLMLRAYKDKKTVARLKSGDALIFGRGVEEIRFLLSHNIQFEIVPGLTSGLAAASLFGIPLTERGVNNHLIFSTGHTIKEDFEHFKEIASLVKRHIPVILYMGLNNLEQIIQFFTEQGVSKETNVLIASKASMPGQELFAGDFTTILDKLQNVENITPAVLFLGYNMIPKLYTSA